MMNDAVLAMDASEAMNELPQPQHEWVQLLDESSGTFYYANIVTRDTSWEAPPSFMYDDVESH